MNLKFICSTYTWNLFVKLFIRSEPKRREPYSSFRAFMNKRDYKLDFFGLSNLTLIQDGTFAISKFINIHIAWLELQTQ